MNKTIEITVHPNGETVIKPIGYTGQSCKDATRALEQALGLKVKEQELPEMHQTQTTHIQGSA
jgi:hypothetical protein